MSRAGTPSLPYRNARASHLRPPSPHRTQSKSPSRLSKRRKIPGQPSSSITSAFSLLSNEVTAQRLSTSLDHGISPAEADARFVDHGPNELPHDEPEPLWLRFLKQFRETLILLLLGSAAVSFIMGNLEDAISITLAVTIVVTVGFVQEYRSEKSLEALSQLVPPHARLIRGGAPSNEGSSIQGGGGSKPDESVKRRDSVPLLQERERRTQDILARYLVPGDLVLFHTGDRIPADIRITRAADLSIDESNLTGENEAVIKRSDALERLHANESRGSPFYASPATGTVGADVRLNEQTNVAFMGTLVRSGYGQGLVVGTGSNTEFGAISASLQEIESPRTPLQLSMDRLGKDLSYISFAVIGFIMLVGLWRGWQFLEMFQIGVSLAVAAIPEGLPIIVTVTLALGVLRMSRRHAIVRRLPSVETLGSVNVVCSDKTGTLTMNHMTVTKLWHFGDDSPVDAPKALNKSDPATRTLLRIGNLANNGRLSQSAAASHATASSAAAILSSTRGENYSSVDSRWVGQPTDVAMLDLLDAFGEDDLRDKVGSRKDETPFSSERKWMGVVIQGTPESDTANVAYIKGALEQVLERCDSYINAQGQEVVLSQAKREAVSQAAETMAQDGLRVLAFASSPASMAQLKANKSRPSTPQPTAASENDTFQGLSFAGIVGMNDPPRPGVEKSIRKLIAGGIKIIMITGDAETTGVAIARKLGMPINMNSAVGRAVIRGDELDRLTDDELSHAIATTSVFARTSPEHKLKIVRALQKRGDVVAMTGDGVNDAPALKKADIGISMGKLGTDVAKEAADMILTDDDFSTILSAIEEGKGIFYNIQNFLTFQLSTSASALSLVLLSTFLGFKNPLNAMQILWINILMDGPPAQSLGVEPVDPSVMLLPPRSRNQRVLNKPLLRRVLQSASIITFGTLFTYVRQMPDTSASGDPLSSRGRTSARDTTMTFTAFVFFDMFNALTCRSSTKSYILREIHPFANKAFNIAVSASLLGQVCVIYLPGLQNIFQTEALSLFDMLGLILLASTVFWADEIRKIWLRKRSRSLGGYSSSV